MHGLGVYTGRSAFLCLWERMALSLELHFSEVTVHLTEELRTFFSHSFAFFIQEEEKTLATNQQFSKQYSNLMNNIALCIWLFLLPCVSNVLLTFAIYVKNSRKHTLGLLTPKYTSCSKCEISQICTCHINYISKAFSKG